MSIRLGRSMTCCRREKLVRARGATIVLLKMRQPPLTACRVGGARKLGAEPRRIADAHAPPQPPLWRRRRKRPLQSVAQAGGNAPGRDFSLFPTLPDRAETGRSTLKR